jgi:hypothetical protein
MAAIFLAALAVAALATGPVLAATKHQPGGWVRFEGGRSCGYTFSDPGSWKGKDIHNTTAVNQTAIEKTSAVGCDGDYMDFTVTIQNGGTTSDHFKVKGGGAYSQTKYFKGGTNITSQVKAGTYQTASLAARAKTTITVRIDPGWAESVLVTLTSAADSTKKDAVKAGVKTYGCGC